jgi:hypothetical protein
VSDQTAGVIGLIFLLGVFLFLWWWFGLKTVLIVIGVSFVALLVLGVVSKRDR